MCEQPQLTLLCTLYCLGVRRQTAHLLPARFISISVPACHKGKPHTRTGFATAVPQAFTHDSEVASVAAGGLLLAGPYALLDAFQCVGQGVIRGAGRQSLGAVVALGSYYGITLPCELSSVLYSVCCRVCCRVLLSCAAAAMCAFRELPCVGALVTCFGKCHDQQQMHNPLHDLCV